MKKELGDELIGMLDQIFKFYYIEYGKDAGNYNLGGKYRYLQKLLEFPPDAGISTRMVSESSSSDDSSDE